MARWTALTSLLFVAACASPPAAPAPREQAQTTPPAPAHGRAETAPPDPARTAPAAPASALPEQPPLDPAQIRIRTRVARHEDCAGSPVNDYLRLTAPAPNRLVARWLNQNTGEPFRARVDVRRGRIRLDIEAVDDPLGGLICGAQAYHLRTVVTGLPAGSYRVIGPEQPMERVGNKLVPTTPRSRARITVTGRPAAPDRPWSRKLARRRFEP